MLGIKTLYMIRKNLQYLRKKIKKKSLDDMALEIVVSRDTLYKLENNDDTSKPLYPNIRTLLLIAEYFEIELHEFISKDFEMDDIDKFGIENVN